MTDFSGYKSFAKIAAWFTFIYIVLFQSILPPNLILPSPASMIDSLGSLFGEYNFVSALGLTSFTVVLIPILGFLCCYVTRYYSPKLFLTYDLSSTLLFSFRFFSYVFLLAFMVYWFGQSWIAELVFLMLVAGLEQKIFLAQEVRKINSNYFYALHSFGLSEKEIIKKVYSKLLKPYVFEKIHMLFLLSWGWALIYEMISGNYGLGKLMLTALKYQDISILTLTIVITIILIYVSGLLFKLIEYKIISWIPDELE